MKTGGQFYMHTIKENNLARAGSAAAPAAPPARRVLLQDCRSKWFLTEDGRWTSDAGQARDFVNTVNAVSYTLAHRLAGTQVVIRFCLPTLNDVVVPLSCEHKPGH